MIYVNSEFQCEFNIKDNMTCTVSSLWNEYLLNSHWINVTQMHNGSSEFKRKCSTVDSLAKCLERQFAKSIKMSCTILNVRNVIMTILQYIWTYDFSVKILKMLYHLTSCQRGFPWLQLCLCLNQFMHWVNWVTTGKADN